MSKYWRMTGSIGLSRPLERAERAELEEIIKENFWDNGEEGTTISEAGDYITFESTINHLPSNIDEHLLPFLDECEISYGGQGDWSNEEWESGFWEVDVDEILLYTWKELYESSREEISELRKKYKDLKEPEATPLPYLLYFWAPWCQPCKHVSPLLDEIAKEFAGKALVHKISTDDNLDLVSKYKVQAIPAIFAINAKGEIKGQVAGVVTKGKLQEMIRDVL